MELRKHNWTQHAYDPSGFIHGIGMTCIQVHICRNCGLIIPLPDCGKKTCIDMMMDCKNEKPPKEKWEHPIKDVRREDIDKKDYPAKRNGHEAKKRRK